MKESVKSPAKNKNRGAHTGLRANLQKTHAKILKSYYGNPTKKLKLIAITGTTGKVTVAHYVHEILRAAGEQVAVLASESPFSMRTLHKFLSDALKAGAKYAVVTVPAEGLRDNIFYSLPITVAAMTNFITAGLGDMTPGEYLENEQTLFKMHPEITVLNADDAHYRESSEGLHTSNTSPELANSHHYTGFSDFHGTKETLIYGQAGEDVKILSSKLYPRGTEATLAIRGDVITVASFVTGETTVSYMACAAAIAYGLGITTDYIIEGIANYDAE